MGRVHERSPVATGGFDPQLKYEHSKSVGFCQLRCQALLHKRNLPYWRLSGDGSAWVTWIKARWVLKQETQWEEIQPRQLSFSPPPSTILRSTRMFVEQRLHGAISDVTSR